MSGVATAIAGSAVIGAVVASKSSKSAAKTQTNANNAALTQEKQMYDQTRADFAPYRQAGTEALSSLKDFMGQDQDIPTDYAYKDFNFQEDPGYQFRLNEGNKAIDRSAASRGTYDSGSTLKALTRYGSDYASQEYGASKDRYNTDRNFDYGVFSDIWNRKAANRDNTFNQLSQVAQIGSGMTSSLGSIGTNVANSASNLITNAGDATAAGQVGSANAIGGGLTNAAGGVSDYLTLQQLLRKPTMGKVAVARGAGSP